MPSIEGTIVDIDNRKPVENAVVIIWLWKYSILQVLNPGGAAISRSDLTRYATTDRNGYFRLGRRLGLSLEPIDSIDVNFRHPFFEAQMAYTFMKVGNKSRIDLGVLKMKRIKAGYIDNRGLIQYAKPAGVYSALMNEIKAAGYTWEPSCQFWDRPKVITRCDSHGYYERNLP